MVHPYQYQGDYNVVCVYVQQGSSAPGPYGGNTVEGYALEKV